MKHSYDIDSYRNPKAEAHRLETRAKARLDDLIPQLKVAGLKPSMKCIDIGSGTALRTLHLGRYLRSGYITGVDISPKLIAKAQQNLVRSGLKNVNFMDLDFTEQQLPKNHFNFAYTRLVTQHVRKPIEMFRNVRQSLKKGGTFFIEETDRDMLFIYPTVDGWDDVYKKVKSTQTQMGGDPNSGRKLSHYLLKAGFVDIKTRVIPVYGSGDIVGDWLENYATTFLNNLSLSDAKKGSRLLKKLTALHKSQQIYFFQAWFQAWGRR